MKTPLLYIAIFLFSSSLCAQEAITVPELRKHIEYLASDDLQGRLPGSEGGKKAAEYIRDQLADTGLRLLGDNGFQYFDVMMDARADSVSSLIIGDYNAVLNQDFVPVSFSADKRISALPAFAGYGLSITTSAEDDQEEFNWNDYKNVDFSGKLVIVLRGSPDDEVNAFNPHISLRQKVMIARDQNAAGVLFVSGEQYDPDDELMKMSIRQARIPADLPLLHISRSTADKILKGSGWTIKELEEKIKSESSPFSFELENKISITAKIQKTYVPTQNIVGFLDNNSSKKEYLILGGHYDHLGLGGYGSGSRRPDTSAVHNGANDNASGISAILEIIERLKAHQDSLKRSVLFIAFGAEERGLFGSKYYTNNPFFDLKKASLMFNLDMIGGYDPEEGTLTAGGTGTAVGLSEIVNQFALEHNIEINEMRAGLGPSDHASFYAKDVPALFLFSGMTGYYHTPVDDIDSLNFEGLKTIADLTYDLLVDIANRPEVMEFQEAGPKERSGGGGRFKVTLGIMPDIDGGNVKGLRVEAVMPNRPAALAGMLKGDVIIGMEDKTINNIYDYMGRLKTFKKGQKIIVEVMRNGKKQLLYVEL